MNKSLYYFSDIQNALPLASASNITNDGVISVSDGHALTFAGSSNSFAGWVLKLVGDFNGNTTTVDLHFTGTYAPTNFSVQSGVNGGTLIAFVPAHT